MPVDVMKAFEAKYPVKILEGYGLSETSPVASFNMLDRPRKPGSIGYPVWGVEMCDPRRRRPARARRRAAARSASAATTS